MFIATKDTKIIAIHEVEWQCRRKAKGLSKPEYWTWLATVTSEDENGRKTYDFSGEDYGVEEDYSIVTNLNCPKCESFVQVYYPRKEN